MPKLTAWMDATLYPAHKKNWDDEMFRETLLGRITATASCLDYGAGRGNVTQMNFRGIARFVAGIDPEAQVFENPHLDDAKLLDLTTNVIPYPDNSFDVVFADNVMEHVDEPTVVFNEIRRVLKPGGVFLAKTPNKGHYMPVIARITPTWFHRYYNRLRGREAIDTFPTRYRCNTRSDVARHAAAAALRVREVRFVEGRPEYLRLTALTYLFGYLYERIVNLSALFSGIRCVMVFELEKKA